MRKVFGKLSNNPLEPTSFARLSSHPLAGRVGDLVRLVTAALVSITLGGCSLEETLPISRLSVWIQSGRLSFAEEQIAEIEREIVEIVIGCGFNSLDTPNARWAADPSAEWKSIRSGSHLRLRYIEAADNVTWSGRTIPIEETLIGIHEDRGVFGAVLTRHGDFTVRYSKCRGDVLVKLGCSEPLATRLPESFAKWCRFASE